MRRAVAIVLGVSLLGPAAWAAEKVPPGSQKAKDSYSLGYEFGSNIRRQEVEVDSQMLLDAVRDGLQGKTPALSPQAMTRTLVELRERVAVRQNLRARAFAAKELDKSQAFLRGEQEQAGSAGPAERLAVQGPEGGQRPDADARRHGDRAVPRHPTRWHRFR